MSEGESEMFRGFLDVRVAIDVIEDKFADELNQIRELLEGSTDVQSRAAYSRLSDLIRTFES